MTQRSASVRRRTPHPAAATLALGEDHLRSVLIRDDRDEIAHQLLRYGDASGDGWADEIDTLTMYPDVRRKVVRMLAEIDAKGASGG